MIAGWDCGDAEIIPLPGICFLLVILVNMLKILTCFNYFQLI